MTIDLNIISKTYAQQPCNSLETCYPWGHIDNLGEGISLLIGPAITIAGLAVLFYFIIGSVKLLISGGDKDQVTKARAMITHSIVGLALFILIFAIIPFILGFFGINLRIIP